MKVTINWNGNDTRLQVLTSGFRYFQVQRRRVGGDVVHLPADDVEDVQPAVGSRCGLGVPCPIARQGRPLESVGHVQDQHLTPVRPDARASSGGRSDSR